ncbi:ABC transporter substrate-binding protein [Amphritea sp. HPY]|uniref:ABC transporter substrate-binding protein n=1 Tax=Amphritea sp. HPY TaxID=3421652 RepID=UPI003D7E5BF5
MQSLFQIDRLSRCRFIAILFEGRFLLSPVVRVFLCCFLVASASVHASESVSLQLLWKHQFQFAGYYIAKEKGFYRDEGLDVELIEFAADREPVKMVAEGKAEFAIGRSSIVIERAKGQPIVALFAAFQKSPLMLLSRADAGIATPADLKGRRVMLTKDAQMNVEILAMLLQAGLRGSDFQRQDHSFDISDLVDGNTDAMGSYISNEPHQMISRNLPYTVLHPANFGFEMYSDILFTSADLIRQKPDLVARFRRASLKGWQYAFSHIDESARLIHNRYNSQHKSLEALVFEGRALRSLAYVGERPLGDINIGRFNSMANIYLILNLIRREYDLTGFVYQADRSESHLLLRNRESEYLAKHKSVTVCVDPNWMPYSGIVQGQATGMDAEYIRYLEEKLHIDLALVPTTSWQESLVMAEHGGCTLLLGAVATPDRKRFLNFTAPYRRISVSLAVRKSAADIASLDQLWRHKVGVVEGGAYHEYLTRNYPEIEVVTVKNSEQGVLKVASGELFAMLAPHTTLSRVFRLNNLYGMKIEGPLKEDWALAIGVAKGEPILLEVLDRTLRMLTNEDSFRISAKWVGIEPGNSGYIQWLWWSILLLTSIVALILYRYYRVAHLSRSLRQVAEVDSLTGAFNRRKIDQELTDLVAKRRSGLADKLAVIFLDVDKFKRINDGYGHDVGDQILQELSRLITHSTREADLFGRWGGEEFIVILPNTDMASAMTCAGQLQEMVNKHLFPAIGTLTCSYGVAELETGETTRELMHKADKALYEAKRAGGNCVRCSNTSMI